MQKGISPDQLNIGDGHPLDLIRTANPTKEDYTTYWGKQPFPIEAGGEAIRLRHIAKKFARELADRIINRKAEAEDKNVIHYLPERLEILNSILLEVVEPYGQASSVPPDQGLQKGETALDIGRRNTLNELGIPDKPPTSGKEDVAANIVDKKPKVRSPMEIKKEKDKLVARAKVLKIKVQKKWSLERIKKAILEG